MIDTHEPVVVAYVDELTRPQWLEARRRGLGGSDAATVAGIDPWRSRWELWHEKTGRAGDRPQTTKMEWGQRLEATIADWFADETGLPVERAPMLLAHPAHEWMLASVDRWVGDDAILECKTTDARNAELWENGPPLYYAAQVNHYLSVSGRQRAHVAVLIGGNDPRRFTLERDDELIDMLIGIESVFWHDYVLADVEPPITALASDTKLLGRLWTPEEGSETLLEPEARELLAERAEANAEIAKHTEVVDYCENQLKRMLGDAEIGLDASTGETLCTWKSQTQRRVSVDRLREEQPDIADAYTEQIKFRKFYVPQSKGKKA